MTAHEALAAEAEKIKPACAEPNRSRGVLLNLLGVVCPKCGCVPRSVLTRRLVKEQIYVEKDGGITSMGFKLIPLTKKERAEADPNSSITLECSGGHKWTHTIPPTTPDEVNP